MLFPETMSDRRPLQGSDKQMSDKPTYPYERFMAERDQPTTVLDTPAFPATQEQRDLLKIGTDAIIQRHFDRHRLMLPDTSEPDELEQLSKWNETYRPYAEADAKTVLEAIGVLTTRKGDAL